MKLEKKKILWYWTKDIKSAAKCQVIEPLTEKKKTGMRLSWFAGDNKNGWTFHSFHQAEKDELLAKNIAKTVRRQQEEFDQSGILKHWRFSHSYNEYF